MLQRRIVTVPTGIHQMWMTSKYLLNFDQMWQCIPRGRLYKARIYEYIFFSLRRLVRVYEFMLYMFDQNWAVRLSKP